MDYVPTTVHIVVIVAENSGNGCRRYWSRGLSHRHTRCGDVVGDWCRGWRRPGLLSRGWSLRENCN